MDYLELYFSGKDRPELDRTKFFHRLLYQEVTAVRGVSKNAVASSHTFSWTPAVQAAAILLLRAAARAMGEVQTEGAPIMLKGEAQTPASSLDFALSRQPAWLYNMFGTEPTGEPLAKQIFNRENSERKQGSVVAVLINSDVVPGAAIHVFLDGRKIQSADSLLMLADAIEEQWVPHGVGSGKEGWLGAEKMLVAPGSAKPEALGMQSLGEQEEDLHDQYVEIWKSVTDEDEALRRVRALVGHIRTPGLLYLQSHHDIHIVNPEGDANISFKIRAVNISNHLIAGNSHEVWFEHPQEGLEIFGTSDRGVPLIIDMLRGYPNYKQFYCNFMAPLKPLERVEYNYGYFARKMFRSNHYWDFKIHTLTNTAKLSITHHKNKPFRRCKVARESSEGFVLEHNPDVEIETDDQNLWLEWRKEFPCTGEVYRIYWEFYE